MKLCLFDENDRVLLLGEGNFSFSLGLQKHNLGIKLTSSCYESTPINHTAIENIKSLESHGVIVLLGVDATNMENHPDLEDKKFDKIVFNFPHCQSKMRLDLNRNLLRDFFISSGNYLSKNGKILLSLCNGQGGTINDNPRRKWNDSWKVKEMAAHGNFIIQSVEPFVDELFTDYSSTGYRGLDKKFHQNQALTHVFIKVPSPQPADFIPDDLATHFQSLQFKESTDNLLVHQIFHENNLNPPIFTFDLTFTSHQDFDELHFNKILYNKAGRIIKNIKYLRSYEFPDSSNVARTYRLTYQSDDVPLFRKRVIQIHENIITKILTDCLNVSFIK